MSLPMDLHTHTAASGHGTSLTITNLAKAASRKGMTVLGVSDHGPATPGACRESYFRSLKLAPRKRCGITVLYGAEANILDLSGQLDLPSEILNGLDYCIASIHDVSFQPSPGGSLTEAYINAMRSPYVKILGHVDDARCPVSLGMALDLEGIVESAVKNRVLLEINEASLMPGGYRGSAEPNTRRLLELCRKRNYPILISSDSHGAERAGEAPCALKLAGELGFPQKLILNYRPVDDVLRFRSRP